MIESIKLKFGSAPGQPLLNIENPMITVFVGPNNAGKSQVLNEINRFCSNGENHSNLVLDEIFFKAITETEYNSFISKVTSPPRQGENPSAQNSYLAINGQRFKVHKPRLKQALLQPNHNRQSLIDFAQWHSRYYLTNLDGASRMSLVNNQNRGDLKHPNTPFARILTDDTKREKLRTVLYDAFGLYLGIDMSQGDQLHLQFGDVPPPNERTVEDDMLEWSRRAKNIKSVSDGVKAFTGMLLQLFVGNPKIITIDEPEAFLHPSLSFKLGQELAKLAGESNKHVFVSTHSAHFLMGVIQAGVRVNIVRLTYEGGVATARILPEDDLKALMKDPFLRSANVMSGLFYKHVVVTEADADRAFYQEINDRLLENTCDKGCSNTLFLNANGKDTVHRIISPLRRLGIPTASIVDLDVLNQGGTCWTNHLSALSIPTAQHQPLGTQRASTWRALTRNDEKNPKTDGGLSLLGEEDKEAAENLLKQLQDYGFFIVPVGEAEHWLAELEIDRGKYAWLRSIFEKMGNDPTRPEYLKPAEGDVWKFIDLVGDWLKNPSRKGIPVRL